MSHHFKLVRLFSLMLLTSVCHGASNKADWFQCQTAAECVIVEENCGVEWAANKTFAEVSRKNPPRPDDSCKKPLESHLSTTVALSPPAGVISAATI
jgi:hypothetical protein